MPRPEKHALIVAHPNRASFNMAVADRYKQAVEALGGAVVVRDLYRMGFDPLLGEGEIPSSSGFSAKDDIVAERALIADAHVFAFVYPLWFNAPPAILVGYIQRVFAMGFGYGAQQQGPQGKLLLGRGMISFTSSGAAAEWLRSEGGWTALRNLFDDHLAEVCGMRVIDHRHYGRIQHSTPSARIDAHLKDVTATVERCFGTGR